MFEFDLRKLSNVVDNDVVKKIVYIKLVLKVNPIDAFDVSELVKENWLQHKN